MALGMASAAHADPCKAIPDKGPMPDYLSPGARFAGPVAYVGDGDSLGLKISVPESHNVVKNAARQTIQPWS